MKRKDDHIKFALRYKSDYNSFDDVQLEHSSLPNIIWMKLIYRQILRDIILSFRFLSMR